MPGTETDVLVLGGGPAGAAAALALARGGRSVTLVTRARRDGPRIGETVPPTIVAVLARLGVWDAFRTGGHVASPGTVVRWGGEATYDNDAIVNPYGCGWHLDRSRFDAMLLDAAAAAGAAVRELPRGGRADYDGRCWRVQTADGEYRRSGPEATLRAPFLVEATGRAARTTARRGVRRRREDRLIGLVRFGTAARTEPRTLLESCEQGWWYAAALPGARTVTALFTDADLLPTARAERERFWADALAGTRLVAGLGTHDGSAPTTLGPARGPSGIHAAPARTSALECSAGPGWVAVGDAARTLDPLSGQGLVAACESAVAAADAVLDPRPPTALAAFSARTAAEHRAHLESALTHYRRETRWATSPFWLRRHRR